MSESRDLKGEVSQAVARAFGLRHDERAGFALGWELYRRIVELEGSPHPKRTLKKLKARAQAEADAAMGRLKQAVAGQPADLLGYRHVRDLPVAGRYVVLSDHHYTFRGHRTNFFAEGGNRGVYVDALRAYADAGFTVIENGDVEDLVIFDPTWTPGEVAARAQMTLPELEARRLQTRLDQLDKILGDPDNAELFEVQRALDADGRLIRMAGNHDYDLQRPDFFARLRQVLPKLVLPSDMLFLRRPDGGAAFAILHGHQFDPATNPVSAPRVGETISEVLGLYYQGPDRSWRWRSDQVQQWATGHKRFRNVLAAGRTHFGQSLRDDFKALLSGASLDLDLHPGEAQGALQSVLEHSGQAIFESLFQADIAWDYFLHDDPAEAVVDEVFTGDRFFKYRILDEASICTQLIKAFPDPNERPTLVLGHSHELRLDAWSPDSKHNVSHYLNSATAGRFENLIWAVEIVDGVSRMVSWSRLPPPAGPVQRREWRTGGEGDERWACAAIAPTSLASQYPIG